MVIWENMHEKTSSGEIGGDLGVEFIHKIKGPVEEM